MKKRILFTLGVVCILCICFFDNHSQCFAAATDDSTESANTIETDSDSGSEFETETNTKPKLQRSGNSAIIPDDDRIFPSIFYDINADAYSSEGWYTKRNETSLTKDNSKLHIFAFNVGQGNCIILRKGAAAVIIDAGEGSGKIDSFRALILPKIKTVLKGAKIKAIFITHPHDDHYNILKEFENLIPKNIPGYFGGEESFWKSQKEKPVLNTVAKKLNIKYISTKEQIEGVKEELGNLMPEVTLTLLSPEMSVTQDIEIEKTKKPEKKKKSKSSQEQAKEKPNRHSLIIKVTYGGRSILFTGDAEGEGVGRFIGHVENKEHVKLLLQYLPPDKSEPLKEKINEEGIKTTKEQSEEAQKFFKANREALEGIDAVFLPHHGSSSENSQRWMGYFMKPLQPTWFVSSTPEGAHKLPTRSIIERCDASIVHKPHAFSYAGEGGTYNKIPLFQFTTKPLYITGAAPGGVYWLRISNIDSNGAIELYDAYPVSRSEQTGDITEEGDWQLISPSPTTSPPSPIQRKRNATTPATDPEAKAFQPKRRKVPEISTPPVTEKKGAKKEEEETKPFAEEENLPQRKRRGSAKTIEEGAAKEKAPTSAKREVRKSPTKPIKNKTLSKMP